ncbi:hypothetical protein SAMN05446935_8605 [Burkholderia sp. YR290]|nr:hypothetical protein SAMN05446935_8605 [Burkholderia sp. YR290]
MNVIEPAVQYEDCVGRRLVTSRRVLAGRLYAGTTTSIGVVACVVIILIDRDRPETKRQSNA